MGLRWVVAGRVSFQRIGFLAATCEMAPIERATTPEALGGALYSRLKRGVEIPGDRSADFSTYLDKLQLSQRYGHLQNLDESALAGRTVESQDYWLSDSGLRASATGAITPDVVTEPTIWATDLGLLRANGCTLMDLGRALREAASESLAAISSPEDNNLFVVSRGFALVALYSMLNADYDFVRAAYTVASEDLLSTEFTRREFATNLDRACMMLRSEFTKRARTHDDTRTLQRLLELAQSIKKSPSGHTRGGARPPDKTATVRLEPYVDIGLITRINRFNYRYRLTDGQGLFFETLIETADAEVFLHQSLVSQYVTAIGIESRPACDEEIWESLQASYTRMRGSSLGYVGFTELSVLAIASLLDRSNPIHFEVADGVRVLKEHQRLDPASVKFTVKRGGGLRYVKLGRVFVDRKV